MPFRRETKPTIDDLAEGHAAGNERGKRFPAPEAIEELPVPADDGDTEGHAIRAGRSIRPGRSIRSGRDATPSGDGDTEGHGIRPGREPRHPANDGAVAPAGEGDERA